MDCFFPVLESGNPYTESHILPMVRSSAIKNYFMMYLSWGTLIEISKFILYEDFWKLPITYVHRY